MISSTVDESGLYFKKILHGLNQQYKESGSDLIIATEIIKVTEKDLKKNVYYIQNEYDENLSFYYIMGSLFGFIITILIYSFLKYIFPTLDESFLYALVAGGTIFFLFFINHIKQDDFGIYNNYMSIKKFAGENIISV
jgi:hypothetical protein